MSNTDDHPRNHALLAMACGSDGSRWANRSVILSGAGRFLLPEQEAAVTLDRVCAVVSSQWRRCYRQAGVSEQDCERLAASFAPQKHLSVRWWI